MTDQITLEEALELVEFQKDWNGEWYVSVVKGDCDIIEGNCVTVKGHVYGTINGRKWQYSDTPKVKLIRLLMEDASKEELMEAFNQLEGN